jgi:hypothetical protein
LATGLISIVFQFGLKDLLFSEIKEVKNYILCKLLQTKDIFEEWQKKSEACPPLPFCDKSAVVYTVDVAYDEFEDLVEGSHWLSISPL